MKTGPGRMLFLLIAASTMILLLTVVSCSTRASNEGERAADTITPEAADHGDLSTPPVPRLVDLGAGKCVPCKMMAPILEELKTEFAGRLDVEFIDVWKNPDAAEPYNIRLIPTQVFLDPQGLELFRHEGFYGRQDILAKWSELGFDFDQDAH
jgi:thioredoxin 1